MKITVEAIEAAARAIAGEYGHTASMYAADAERALEAALPHLSDDGAAADESEWADEERDFVEVALRAADAGNAGHWPTVAAYLAAEVRRLRAGEGATPAIDREALTDTIQRAMCGTVNRDNMTERSDSEEIADAAMALIGTAADSRGVHEAAASLQTAEDIATIIEEYADDLEPPITRDWLVTREWGKDLLHELAARARETGGAQ